MSSIRCHAFGLIRWFAAALLAVSAVTASAQAGYRYTDLGSAWAGSSSANALNDLGQVVGVSTDSQGISSAWLWSADAMTFLPGLAGGNRNAAQGINDAGAVVGYSASQAVLWRGGVPVALSPTGADVISWASGINAAGQVSGSFGTRPSNGPGIPYPHFLSHAVSWSADGTMTMLESGPNSISDGLAINNQGKVAGFVGEYHSNHNPPSTLPAIWSPALSTLPGADMWVAKADDINDRGQVVGTSGSGYTSVDRALLWDNNNGVEELQTLGSSSQALALNEQTQIVGSTSRGSFRFATLWLGGSAIDLNTLVSPAVLNGWLLTTARDINEDGWIIGDAIEPTTGLTHAYLLTPIPEPGTSAMWIFGIGLLGLRWRWQLLC